MVKSKTHPVRFGFFAVVACFLSVGCGNCEGGGEPGPAPSAQTGSGGQPQQRLHFTSRLVLDAGAPVDAAAP